MTMASGADELLASMRRDRWAGATIMRGELPCFVSTVPPTATAAYRGRVGIVIGAAGVADKVVSCLKSAADTYSWVTICTG